MSSFHEVHRVVCGSSFHHRRGWRNCSCIKTRIFSRLPLRHPQTKSLQHATCKRMQVAKLSVWKQLPIWESMLLQVSQQDWFVLSFLMNRLDWLRGCISIYSKFVWQMQFCLFEASWVFQPCIASCIISGSMGHRRSGADSAQGTKRKAAINTANA